MINTIYHIADLHIRADRRTEYLSVFNRLIEYIKNDAIKDESLVVICGDIFHFMTRYQGPDDITDFCSLIDGLSSICPLIIIPGNHDTNMNNRNNRDLITPIYEIVRQYKDNIHYYNKTDVYKYDNIHFAVLGVIDNEPPSVLIDKIKDIPSANNEYKIALVHEDINGATFGDFVIKDARVDRDFIVNFDYVLAGHIHDTQSINVVDSTVKVAYCGALFQQNIGESLSKGLLKWDLRSKTHEFIHIPNDYGAIKLVIEDNQTREIPAELFPKYIKDVMIEHKNSTPEYIKTVIEEFSARHNFVIKRIVDKTPKAAVIAKAQQAKAVYNADILDTSVSQDGVITKFLQDRGANVESIEDVLALHKSYNKLAECKNSNKRWRILSMEWSNLFCYGENNYIDFTRVPDNQLLGIIANNRAGKSSVIDMLIYGLFNKLRRGDVKHITRLGAKYYYLKLVLEVDGITVVIIRQSNGVSGANATTYFSINNDNKTRESVTLTYQDISMYIGTYDDFIRTNIMCQDNSDDFVKLSSINRRKFLIKFFQLDTWMDIESQVRKDILDITKDINATLIPQHTIESIESNYIPAIKGELSAVVRDINTVTAAQTECQSVITRLQNDKDELLKKYETTHITTVEYETARTTRVNLLKKKPVQTVEQLNELLHNKMAEYRQVGQFDNTIDIDNIKIEYDSILAEMKQYDSIRGDIAEVNGVLKELGAERLSIQYKLKSLTAETNPLQRVILSLKAIYESRLHFADCIKYNTECGSCTNNKALVDSLMADIQLQENKTSKLAADLLNIKDNEIEIVELQRKLTTVTEEEREVNDLLDNLIKKQKIRERYIKVRDIITNYNDIVHNSQVTKHVDYIKKVIEQVKLLQEVEKTITTHESNLDITNKLCIVNAGIGDHTARMQQLQTDMIRLSKRYGELETKLNNTEELLTRLKGRAAHRDRLRLYLTCLDSKTGIPFKILSNALITLEDKVNNLLNRITDFNLSFINDDDGKKESELRVSIVNGGAGSMSTFEKKSSLPIELGSGFQQFIISIILRISLAQMFPAQLSDFFVIDEGFSCMDAANINNTQQFLLYIKQYFRFILIISHLDVLQNMIEYPINIDTSNGVSIIKNIDTVQIQHEVLLKSEKQSKLVKKDVNGIMNDGIINTNTAIAAPDGNTIESVSISASTTMQTLTTSTLTETPINTPLSTNEIDDKKKDSIICDYCKIDVARSYYARHVKTKKHEQAVKSAAK